MSSNPLLNLSTFLFMHGDIFNQLLEQSGKGGSLDSLLKPRKRSGKEIMAEALTGRIRANSGGLRQAERNALEAKEISSILQNASEKAGIALQAMREIADKVDNSGLPATSADIVAYDEAFNSLQNIVKNTRYNGIPLMDKKAWPGDERLKTNGDTASLPISMGPSSRNITLHDFSGISGADVDSTALSTNAGALKSTLEEYVKRADQYAISYKGVSAGFESSAKALGKQADINDKAALRSILGSRDDPAGKLLYYIMKEHGNIINKPS